MRTTVAPSRSFPGILEWSGASAWGVTAVTAAVTAVTVPAQPSGAGCGCCAAQPVRH